MGLFVARWQASGAAERANYALFLSELCDVLGVPRPDPARDDDRDNAYVLERHVRIEEGDGTHTTGRIDLYKRGCFVLEAKQGSAASVADGPGLFGDAERRSRKRGTAVRGSAAWDEAMEKARGQAERYVRALPPAEGNPPFLVVVDVGHTIELYAEFSRLGRTYTPFPDARNHRIALADLAKPEVRDRLARVWAEPLSLDPARRSAKVTREVADRLAKLAKSLEAAGHHPETVAEFLMRCIFTCFAEDVKLIKDEAFTKLLKDLKGNAQNFPHMVQPVWREMDKGTAFSPVLKQKVLRFNGGLFEHSDALAISEEQLALLIEAAAADWSDVEPAIFGTLLERALSPGERHKLGAHYTPRAYVERLVLPTVIEPLREQFDAAKAAAFTLNFQGDPKAARAAIGEFLNALAKTVVLDPACGSGNFLYVTMDHMKRLEEEARDVLRQLGQQQEVMEFSGLTVDPHQFLGLELNPRAVAIADLVLWIGYLQFHYRAHGQAEPAQPVLRAFHNIREQDAVLAYDRKELVTDEQGKPVTRWDGKTMKISPVTSEEVPDETARVPVYRYVNPRKAEWPTADYVVGNPPFIGNWKMRQLLGEGYALALRDVHDDVPESSDYVMYWWNTAAALTSERRLRQFGLITTNKVKQAFNRRVLEKWLSHPRRISITFAIPNHPWVDESGSADVRISMTCARFGASPGVVREVVSEQRGGTEESGLTIELDSLTGEINGDLSAGVRVTGLSDLRSNMLIGNRGVQPIGAGFIISKEKAEVLGLGRLPDLERYIRPYLNAKDVAQRPRHAWIIDLFPLGIEDVKQRYPEVYQWVYDRVKPERDQNNRASYKKLWWIFGEPVKKTREAIGALDRFVVTPRTAKHRVFLFVDNAVVPDSKLVTIALSDAFHLAVLSSTFHVQFATRVGGWLGVGDDPTYNHTDCFNPFPFPATTEGQQSRIRELGESLDAHRKRQQAAHPGLTITDMYNVLAKLRGGEALTDKDRRVHEQGLVSVLRQVHDDLDAAVADAYGWPVDLPDDELLRRLVALNAERAAEERRGVVRWLRPEFQNPAGTRPDVQAEIDVPAGAGGARAAKPAKRPAWPKTLAEQARAVRAALAARAGPATPAELAREFAAAKAQRVAELLATLTALGQARDAGGGRYAA